MCQLHAKIYMVVNSQEDIESLRNDMKNLVKWSVDWQMLFNADNLCKITHTGHSNCHADYYMYCNKLKTVDEEQDLGVTVSKDLKWDKQCSQAVKKANRMLEVIKKNFTDRSRKTIMPLYKSLVRPHLEYCVNVFQFRARIIRRILS